MAIHEWAPEYFEISGWCKLMRTIEQQKVVGCQRCQQNHEVEAPVRVTAFDIMAFVNKAERVGIVESCTTTWLMRLKKFSGPTHDRGSDLLGCSMGYIHDMPYHYGHPVSGMAQCEVSNAMRILTMRRCTEGRQLSVSSMARSL